MNLELEKILFTLAIADAVSNSKDFSVFVFQSIEKHKAWKWSDCDSEDSNMIDYAFQCGGRIL